MSLLKRLGLGLSAIAISIGIASNASARNYLNIQYASHSSSVLKKSELSLRVPVKKGGSYALIAGLYTGNQKNASTIQAFNDNKPLFYVNNPNPKTGEGFVYIPISLLKQSLKKVFEENDFSTFVIDNQGDEGISNLWEVAEEFMINKWGIEESINILLALNDEINPIKAFVYNGQKILVPESLVDKKNLKNESKPKETFVQKPTPKPPQQKPAPKVAAQPQKSIEPNAAFKPAPVTKPEKASSRQNPLRHSLASLKKNMDPTDKFNSRRIRGTTKNKKGKRVYNISKHKGLDLSAPVGTPLYPTESGTVIEAGKERDKKLWRNGNVVTISTASGRIVKYLHLSRVNVKAGNKVGLNTKVGEVGITGNASKNNPHVHIQIKENGKVVDPTAYIMVDSSRNSGTQDEM